MVDMELTSLIFAIVLFSFIAGCWYWVWFMNGAQKWSDSLIKSKQNIYSIKYDPSSFLVKPIVLKIVITIILLCAITIFVSIILQIDSN